ncbi:MAG: thiamine-phosphate kinase [Planctomycetes bacterium]|nr:thiamine-phosphate kinase [Planctomycetota bacterium]
MVATPTGGEFARIRWIRKRTEGGPRVTVGPGDDCAVLRPRAGEEWVWTIDGIVEGVHFLDGWLTPRELGRKSVEISLSDLAAMGARPIAILAAAEVPAALPERMFRDLCRGIGDAAADAGATLAGGNLSRSPGPLAITTTALGSVRQGRAILRSGARPGDEIWMTGVPGLAALGLAALERWGRRGAPRAFRPGIGRLVRPRARIREALWLARLPIRAMIDTSDGLLADLRHVLRESGAGAALDLPPPASTFRRMAERLGRAAVDLLLAGGEDYELVICAPSGILGRLRARFERRFGIPLRPIGRVTRGAGIRARLDGRTLRLPRRGFDHFA